MATGEINRLCPNDGAIMRRDVRPMKLAYKGESATVKMPGWYCDTCGESIHSGADMKESDRAVNLLKAHVEHLAEPADVRRIRTKLKLSQAKASMIIGGGPHSFQKYECGDVLPSRAITNLLKLLDHDPAGLRIILHSDKPVLADEAPAKAKHRSDATRTKGKAASLSY
jgi:HTH-type transcriptional regulator / antitoxin MqsA